MKVTVKREGKGRTPPLLYRVLVLSHDEETPWEVGTLVAGYDDKGVVKVAYVPHSQPHKRGH